MSERVPPIALYRVACLGTDPSGFLNTTYSSSVAFFRPPFGSVEGDRVVVACLELVDGRPPAACLTKPTVAFPILTGRSLKPFTAQDLSQAVSIGGRHGAADLGAQEILEVLTDPLVDHPGP